MPLVPGTQPGETSVGVVFDTAETAITAAIYGLRELAGVETITEPVNAVIPNSGVYIEGGEEDAQLFDGTVTSHTIGIVAEDGRRHPIISSTITPSTDHESVVREINVVKRDRASAQLIRIETTPGRPKIHAFTREAGAVAVRANASMAELPAGQQVSLGSAVSEVLARIGVIDMLAKGKAEPDDAILSILGYEPVFAAAA